jgi:enoyl-CoA hydratase/carnithine racemase
MTDQQSPEFQTIKLRVEGGIVEARLHRDDGPLVWGLPAERDLIALFAWMADLPDLKVLVLTGTGETFCTEIDSSTFRDTIWRETWRLGQTVLNAAISCNMPIISAINGPAWVHSEIPLLGDIILCTEDTTFADVSHFPRGIVPGDGVHSVWASLLGTRRASYFFLTKEVVTAAQGVSFGFVHELLARDEIVARAWELARQLAEQPASTLHFTKAALRMRERRHFGEEVSHGLAIEGLAMYATGKRGADPQ